MKISQLRLAPVGLLILIWTLFPVYHILVMALTPAHDAVSGAIFPKSLTLENFRIVFGQKHHFLDHFWIQLGNSLFVAIAVSFVVIFIASLASFAITRLKARGGEAVSNLALLTYLLPAAFFVIPIYQTINRYGLLDTRLGLIATMVSFATPYAIWLLNQAGANLPKELDEAARIDGASSLQLFWLVYLPLLAPSLVAVGTYALLLSWNEYLYALVLLSSEDRMTVPVGLNNFLNSDSPPWNLLMATGLIYSLPPVAIFFFCRKFLVGDLAEGAVKG